MNICVTGLNYERVRRVSIELAKKIDYDFVDASAEFEPALLKASLYPIARSEKELTKNEIMLLVESSEQENCVVSLEADMFLPEGYADILKNCLTVALLEKKGDFDFGLQKLIADKCKVKAFNLNELLSFLKGKI